MYAQALRKETEHLKATDEDQLLFKQKRLPIDSVIKGARRTLGH